MLTDDVPLNPPRGRGDKLSEMVAREIVHDVAARELRAGVVLGSEADLLARYNVGRAALREALRILEMLGLVVSRPGPGGGPVVAAVSSREFARTLTFYFHVAGATFRELLAARLALEPMMAAVAARQQDPAGLRALEQATGNSELAATDSDRDWADVTTEFHEVVAGMSGNRILDLFGRALKVVYHERIRSLVYPPSERERVREAHAAIAKAIIKGDALRAEKLMRAHMEEMMSFTADRFPGLLDDVVDWR